MEFTSIHLSILIPLATCPKLGDRCKGDLGRDPRHSQGLWKRTEKKVVKCCEKKLLQKLKPLPFTLFGFVLGGTTLQHQGFAAWHLWQQANPLAPSASHFHKHSVAQCLSMSMSNQEHIWSGCSGLVQVLVRLWANHIELARLHYLTCPWPGEETSDTRYKTMTNNYMSNESNGSCCSAPGQ